MQGGTLVSIVLFFVGSFALLYTTIHIPQVEFYTGGIVIALYLVGLFYAFGNTIRQAKKIKDPVEAKTTREEEQRASEAH